MICATELEQRFENVRFTTVINLIESDENPTHNYHFVSKIMCQKHLVLKQVNDLIRNEQTISMLDQKNLEICIITSRINPSLIPYNENSKDAKNDMISFIDSYLCDITQQIIDLFQ